MSRESRIQVWRPIRKWKDGTISICDYDFTTDFNKARQRAFEDQEKHAALGYTMDDVECKVESVYVLLERRE